MTQNLNINHHPAIAMAQIQREAGNLTSALSILEDALRHQPLDRHLLHARAHAHIALRNLPQAEKDLDSVTSLFPDDAEGWDDRGVLFQWRGDYFRAAECHMRAVDLQPSEGIILNLAIALNHLSQRDQARKLYEAVLQINPLNTKAMTNLAVMADEDGDTNSSEALLKAALAEGDESFEVSMAYGNLCRKAGRKEEATDWYEKAVGKRPNNLSAKFLLDTMKGKNPEAPPAGHVADLFDGYADTFDANLVEKLKYRAPELLLSASEKELTALKEKKGILIGIDLGAGTGLFGSLLRPYLAHSTALDLSPRMLQKAETKKIYDNIVCADIVEGLNTFSGEHFDVISAADVFTYVGKLEQIFKSATKTLKTGGLFIFSAEATDDDTSDYLVRDTGRYAHSDAYLKRLAKENGFESIHFERTWIRYNKEQPLDGFVVVLKKI